MAISKMIQSLFDLVDDEKIYENEEFKKQDDEYGKWSEILEKYIEVKDDKKLQRILSTYYLEQGKLESIEKEIYFREGFLYGAKLMMEICGYKRVEK